MNWNQILTRVYDVSMQTYFFLTAAQDISQYIDDVFVLGSWNKGPTGSHLLFCCYNDSKFCHQLIVDLFMKKNKKMIQSSFTLAYFANITNNKFWKRSAKSDYTDKSDQKFFSGLVNGILNRNLSKLKYQKICKSNLYKLLLKIYGVSVRSDKKLN